ncbi:16S rRNA (cytosine(1402)-N(4))-methyltransferase RsmH [Oceanispirochaeta sp.]|jgi:16S rRNA (cytosine1402-N4)-methyltransferase|uniref:16S rRNA (cytosine(1402)-N(4))-methyltransferase RsmH n=1 Tax=Oceanispirochaeta sp. TaxID=2035350 RepID=UPI00260E90BF|nr:16S rRNA (cytosine(1402)-N(4))-methyltransferase RsmH [Oceanispirochaeta sp.]MDA3956601.1 16S rRNA (cytosine(1402)-N(4))-methyltransferase RsmH [Oceanispirochaeta sp.]
MEEQKFVHFSIMKEEVCSLLAPDKPGQLLVDCTMGEGGHSLEFLSRFPDLNVVGLDADPEIQKKAKERLASYGDRVSFENTYFDQYFKDYLGLPRPDRILIDLGISMFHYEESGRGFTFRKDEPLDMRLNPENPLSASIIVNEYEENDLANLIYEFGEERYSRRIARAIVRERSLTPLESAFQLAEIISHSVPPAYRHGRIHPATRSFQAIRIAVNDELGRLRSVLQDAVKALNPGGLIGVITFHSLEDRIVKHFFKDLNRDCICPPQQPRCSCGGARVVDVITRKPLVPTPEEIKVNPASRSSKLRVARRISDFWRESDV